MDEGKVALSINEAAEFLGVHPQTIRKLARKGDIPAFKVGRAWRFHTAALQRWIEMQQQRVRSPLVLVVDDERSIRQTVAMSLEGSGYRVNAVASAAAAVEAVHRELPDAVVLDLAMPDVSGVHVLKELHGIDPGVPVIIVTGYPDGALMQEALQYSPLLVIAKPVRSSELVRAVDGAVNRPRP